MSDDRSQAIARAFAALADGGVSEAAAVIKRDYFFAPSIPKKRVIRDADAVAVFIRDGFIDRYSGKRLVFPGALLLLSRLLPEEVPYHPNWRADVTHAAYWELFPTIDHVEPITRGGPPDPALSNWVTTSMLMNGAKANWTIEELRWTLHPPGDMKSWDGLLGPFLEYSRFHPKQIDTPSLRRWHRAAARVRP